MNSTWCRLMTSSQRRSWWSFPLWTEDEGLSDLTLELRLVEAYPSAFETEITGLHVM